MGDVHTGPEAEAHTPAWRDPLSMGFRAHRHLLLLRLRWHERRAVPASEQRRPQNDARPARRRPLQRNHR
jgi:hypothetical protein